MGMLITVIRYLSYVTVVNCTKARLRGGRYTMGRREKWPQKVGRREELTEKVGRREIYAPLSPPSSKRSYACVQFSFDPGLNNIFVKKLINRELNRKRTGRQNHASFEFRRFLTLAASFDLWTRSLGAIYFWKLDMTIHYLGLFLVSEGWLIFGEFGCFWKKKPQRIQFVTSKKLCRPRQRWKTQTPQKNLTRKLRQTPLSGVYPHRSQF